MSAHGLVRMLLIALAWAGAVLIGAGLMTNERPTIHQGGRR